MSKDLNTEMGFHSALLCSSWSIDEKSIRISKQCTQEFHVHTYIQNIEMYESEDKLCLHLDNVPMRENVDMYLLTVFLSLSLVHSL